MTFDQLLGVNDQAKAVGFWTDANGNNHGFTYDVKSGNYSEVNIAGFASTTTTAINNEGHIAGFVVEWRCRHQLHQGGQQARVADRAEGCRVGYGSRHQQRRPGGRILHRRKQPDAWLPIRRAIPHLQDHRRSEPAQRRWAAERRSTASMTRARLSASLWIRPATPKASRSASASTTADVARAWRSLFKRTPLPGLSA